VVRGAVSSPLPPSRCSRQAYQGVSGRIRASSGLLTLLSTPLAHDADAVSRAPRRAGTVDDADPSPPMQRSRAMRKTAGERAVCLLDSQRRRSHAVQCSAAEPTDAAAREQSVLCIHCSNRPTHTREMVDSVSRLRAAVRRFVPPMGVSYPSQPAFLAYICGRHSARLDVPRGTRKQQQRGRNGHAARCTASNIRIGKRPLLHSSH
jgi:hypothetical protein